MTRPKASAANAKAGALPLGSALVLPFVPLFAGYPLRRANEPSALSKPVLHILPEVAPPDRKIPFKARHSLAARSAGR